MPEISEAFPIYKEIDQLKEYGKIGGKWLKIKGLKFLGFPSSDVESIPQLGFSQNYMKGPEYYNQGAIYYFNGTAKEIHGGIYENWIINKRHLTLGYPIDDEKPVENSKDSFSNFQHGKLYWNASNNVVTCYGKCN